jgi:hypothetical protein
VVRTDLSTMRWRGGGGRCAAVRSERAEDGKDTAVWLGGGYRRGSGLGSGTAVHDALILHGGRQRSTELGGGKQ